MTYEEKWKRIGEIDRRTAELDAEIKELWREKTRLLMTRTSPSLARDNRPKSQPGRRTSTMKTKRPAGTREWGYRMPTWEYFTFCGDRSDAIATGQDEAHCGGHDHFEIIEGRLTWNPDERSDAECNENDEWFVGIGDSETITTEPQL
jgi:hypothetical protein